MFAADPHPYRLCFRALAVMIACALMPAGAAVAGPRRADGPSTVEGNYLVRLKSQRDVSRSRDIARSHGGRATFVYDAVIEGFAFAGSDSQAARLARDPRVADVEPDRVVRFADDPDPRAGRLDVVGANQARDAGYATGNGVRIAILDSGIRRNHPVFADHANFMGWHGRCAGKKNANDRNGHGTAVASNAVGQIGVAHEAQVYAVKIFPGASSSTSWARVVCGLNRVKKWNEKNPAEQISVVNLSLAGAGSRSLKRAIKRLVKTGVVVVAAAGNNGRRVQFPARYNFVIGATAMNNAGTAMARFSSGGKGADLTAPGAKVLAANRGKGFRRVSGTSYSSPQVAGAAAVVLSEDPNGNVLDVLQATGTCPDGGVNGSPGFCPTGRWKRDDRNAEPRINVHCAAVAADPLAVVPPECT